MEKKAKKDKKSGATAAKKVDEVFNKLEGKTSETPLNVVQEVKKDSEKKSKKNIEEEKKASKINDGKCCRCCYRKNTKICGNSKSPKHGKYVARKFGCSCFKYND